MKHLIFLLFGLCTLLQSMGQSPSDSLVLDLPLNGNAQDFSGFLNHGTLHGVQPDTNRFGEPGSCFRFNGVDSYIEIPASPSLNRIQTTQRLSISAWINIRAWHSSGNVFSIFERYQSSSDAGWLFEANWVGGGLLFLADAGSTSNWVGCQASIPFREWHHICLTYDRDLGLARFYVDGQEACSKSYSASIQLSDTTAPFVIGRSLAGPDEWSDGWIDDYKVYYRVLQPSQIQTLFTAARKPEPRPSRIRLQPDPSGRGIRVNFPDNQSGGNLEIQDAIGRTVQSLKIPEEGEYLTTESWPSGLYLFRISNGTPVKWWKN